MVLSAGQRRGTRSSLLQSEIAFLAVTLEIFYEVLPSPKTLILFDLLKGLEPLTLSFVVIG